jgi:integrase
MWRIYKRKKGGPYHAYVSAGDKHKRFSTHTRDEKTAQNIARDEERKLIDPTYKPANEATIGGAVVAVIARKKELERSFHTLEGYRFRGGHLVRILGADKKLSSLTCAGMEDYVEKRKAEGAQKRTIAFEMSIFKSTLEHAKHRGCFHGDIEALIPEHDRGYKPKERYLTAVQARDLMARFHPRRAAWIAFALATGARPGEVERARREDVNLEDMTVLIRGTKTEKSAARIPILSCFLPLIELALEHGDGQDGLLFSGWTDAYGQIVDRCNALGIPRVSQNDFRRTHASWLVQAGVPPYLVAKMLRHTSSAMVERVYGRQTVEAVAALIEREGGTWNSVQAVYKNGRNPPELPERSENDAAQETRQIAQYSDTESPAEHCCPASSVCPKHQENVPILDTRVRPVYSDDTDTVIRLSADWADEEGQLDVLDAMLLEMDLAGVSMGVTS